MLLESESETIGIRLFLSYIFASSFAILFAVFALTALGDLI